MHADAILLAKNVDGVYTADPNIDKNAIKFDDVTAMEEDWRATLPTEVEVEVEEEPVVTVQEMQSGLGDIFRRGWNTFKTFITKEWHDLLDDPLKYIIKRAGDFLPGLWGKGCRLIHQCL